jgi:hypothetical protein
LCAAQASLRLIERLDEGVTFEDILYELCLLKNVERGRCDVQEGRVVSHEEVGEESAEWLS